MPTNNEKYSMRVRPNVVKSGKELKAIFKDVYFLAENLMNVPGYKTSDKEAKAMDKAEMLFNAP
jgi:hypothetical protein